MRTDSNGARHVVARALLSVMFALTSIGHAQTAVPIREVTKPDAISTARFGKIISAHTMPNGSVLVNDGERRQVLYLDPSLSRVQTVIDSSGTGSQTYGSRHASALIAYVADSLLFVDEESGTLVVIDPQGKVSRTMAVPDQKSMQYLWRFPAGFDAAGNFIFRSQFAEKYVPTPRTPAGILPVFPDSAPILRASLETRKIDTIASYKIHLDRRFAPGIDKDGKPTLEMLNNLISIHDDYAVLSSGSIAIVRGHDYHVDILNTDGSLVKGPRLPFDFKRFTEQEKQKMIDSAKAEEDKRIAAMRPPTPGTPRAIGPKGFVPLKDMPDYYPPIRSGAAMSDRDGNLWILPTTSAQSRSGELVYDVVNNRGELKHRVRMPVGRSVAGFGPNGVVLMISNDATGWMIERARVDAKAN